MNFLKSLKPKWILRIGLGLMYLYSGTNIFLHPKSWYWALPYWLKGIISSVVSLDTYLKFQGILEIFMALALLAWFLKPIIVKWVALFSTLEIAGILLLSFLPWNEANFLITFRDIGILSAGLTLVTIYFKNEE